MHTNLTHHPSDHALLTTLIGGQQASIKAQCLLNNIGDVKQLSRLSIPELMTQGELTQHMAHRITQRVSTGTTEPSTTAANRIHYKTRASVSLVWPSLLNQGNELLIGLYLNRRKHLIQHRCTLTQGTDWMTIVDPKQIYQKALLCRASGLILVHNHPSGDPTPSEQDLRITEEIERFGAVLRIPLLDHLIVGSDSYVSLAALGLLSRTSNDEHPFATDVEFPKWHPSTLSFQTLLAQHT